MESFISLEVEAWFVSFTLRQCCCCSRGLLGLFPKFYISEGKSKLIIEFALLLLICQNYGCTKSLTSLLRSNVSNVLNDL